MVAHQGANMAGGGTSLTLYRIGDDPRGRRPPRPFRLARRPAGRRCNGHDRYPSTPWMADLRRSARTTRGVGWTAGRCGDGRRVALSPRDCSRAGALPARTSDMTASLQATGRVTATSTIRCRPRSPPLRVAFYRRPGADRNRWRGLLAGGGGRVPARARANWARRALPRGGAERPHGPRSCATARDWEQPCTRDLSTATCLPVQVLTILSEGGPWIRQAASSCCSSTRPRGRQRAWAPRRPAAGAGRFGSSDPAPTPGGGVAGPPPKVGAAPASARSPAGRRKGARA